MFGMKKCTCCHTLLLFFVTLCSHKVWYGIFHSNSEIQIALDSLQWLLIQVKYRQWLSIQYRQSLTIDSKILLPQQQQ